mmetsp:Transcript_53943/g.144495  ORF Transcript_53943/g.144495 Transcript_53943/m.144495 type:complete len:86 (+) Transcript_53943:491-748(+)
MGLNSSWLEDAPTRLGFSSGVPGGRARSFVTLRFACSFVLDLAHSSEPDLARPGEAGGDGRLEVDCCRLGFDIEPSDSCWVRKVV